MKVELRFYKRYDADLLSLHETGASLTSLTKAAVIAYANGKRARYMVPKCKRFSFDGRRTVRLHMIIEDPRTVELLSHIKNSYINQFCKTVLRDALVTQCIGTYISSSYGLNAENGRLQEIMAELPEDTIILNGKKKRVSINDILKGNGTIKASKRSSKQNEGTEKAIEKIIETAAGPLTVAEHIHSTDNRSKRNQNVKAIDTATDDPLNRWFTNNSGDKQDTHRFTEAKPVPKDEEIEDGDNNIEDFMNMFESITNL